MDRRQVLAGAVGSTAIALASHHVLAAKDQQDLVSRVQALAESYATAWNTSDMDAMAALYADDVHWVNIVGMHWQGKAQVDRAHRSFFDSTFRGVPITLQEVESIRPLTGEGAIAVLRWSVGAYRSPSGAQQQPSRNRMTLVLVPNEDRLVIAHGANIEINEAAQRSNPIRAG